MRFEGKFEFGKLPLCFYSQSQILRSIEVRLMLRVMSKYYVVPLNMLICRSPAI